VIVKKKKNCKQEVMGMVIHNIAVLLNGPTIQAKLLDLCALNL